VQIACIPFSVQIGADVVFLVGTFADVGEVAVDVDVANNSEPTFMRCFSIFFSLSHLFFTPMIMANVNMAEQEISGHS